MNRSLLNSTDDEARLPSYINVSSGPSVERRQPASTNSPRRNSAPKKKKTRPPSSPPTATTANTSFWQEQKSAKHSSSRRTATRETYLITLCRQQQWQDVLCRLEVHPEEAEPKRLFLANDEDTSNFGCFSAGGQNATTTTTSPASKKKKSPPFSNRGGLILYQESALYWVCCQGNFCGESAMVMRVLQELIQAYPKQTIYSYADSGHTALRALVQNSTCTTEVLEYLLQAIKEATTTTSTMEDFKSLCYQPDRDGLTPMDHILQGFHHHHQSSSISSPLKLLQTFLQTVGLSLSDNNNSNGNSNDTEKLSLPTRPSPLIRLLSLGNANPSGAVSAYHQTTPRKTLFQDDTKRNNNNNNNNISTSQLIRQGIQYFLQHFPSLLYQCSLATKCTPLHIALRNYGNDKTLLRCFLLGPTTTTTDALAIEESDADYAKDNHLFPKILFSLQQTNQFGDLPLHVACSVGVPVSVLRLVLEGTLQATTYTYQQHDRNNNNNLCWTVNHAGYTPIDLEWIRHMEDGKGLFVARSFYPLEASGIRKTWWKQDEFYRVLLQQAVQQAMTATSTTTATATNPKQPRRSPMSFRHTTTSSRTRSAVSSSRPDPAQIRVYPNNISEQRSTVASAPAASTATKTNLPPQPSDQPTWELLLHRIFLIIQTAATGQVPKTQAGLLDYLLHAACRLVSPEPPSLPQPLLELILWLHPDQLLQPHLPEQYGSIQERTTTATDFLGNFPLHYAVQPHHPQHQGTTHGVILPEGMIGRDTKDESLETTRKYICNEWQAWIQILLDHSPDTCSAHNHQGRLPIHMMLDFVDESTIATTKAAATSTAAAAAAAAATSYPANGKTKARHHEMTLLQQARLNLLSTLVNIYPGSVDVVDPVSGFLPFQMAAASPHVTLDAVFYLLQRSPDACSLGKALL